MRHLGGEARQDRTPVAGHFVYPRLHFVICRDDLPRILTRRIRFVAALEGDVLEMQPEPADLLLRAERTGKRNEGAVLHEQARGGAVLDLDVVDPGRDPAEHARHRAEKMQHHIVQMQSVGDEHAAELRRPFAPPGDGIIFGRAQPESLDRADIGLARDAGLDDALGFLDAVAVAILEDRHQHAKCLLLGFHDRINARQRSGQRLFADHMLAGGKGREHLFEMDAWRGADVDDVDSIVGEKFLEGAGPLLDPEFVAHFVHPFLVEVAESLDSELVRVRLIALDDMRTPDAAADDGDCLHAHVSSCPRSVRRSPAPEAQAPWP